MVVLWNIGWINYSLGPFSDWVGPGEGEGGNNCRNLSFGLVTKAKGIAKVQAKGKPES